MIELYAIRRDGYDNHLIRDLIRHGVLIPIKVTVAITGDAELVTSAAPVSIDIPTESDVQSQGAPDVLEVDWTGGRK